MPASLKTDALCWKSGNFWGRWGLSVTSVLCPHSLAMENEKLLRYLWVCSMHGTRIGVYGFSAAEITAKRRASGLTGGDKRCSTELEEEPAFSSLYKSSPSFPSSSRYAGCLSLSCCLLPFTNFFGTCTSFPAHGVTLSQWQFCSTCYTKKC